jgi:cobalamin biosynthesis protein CobT
LYDFARRAADKVRAELSHKIVNEIGQCVQEIAGLRNTADAKAMAERILQIVRDALENQQQQQQAAQQQPQDSSESEDSADGGNSEASDANAEGGDDQIEGESPSDDQKADGTEAKSQGVEGEPREGESQRGDSNPDSADSEDPECADESEGGDDQIEGESPSDDQKADGTEAESQGGVGNPSEGASQSGDSTPDGPGAEGSDGEDAQGHAECDATQSSSESGNADAMIQALRAVLDATEDDLPKDIGEVVAQLLNDAAAEYVDDGSMVVAAVEHDPLFTAKPVNPASVALATAGLRQRFLRLLQSKRMKRTKPRRHGADLDTTMLHRIALNDPRVFVNRQRKDGVNTSVLVLLDQSESMLRGNRARVATESALAIAMALEMIPGVKVAVAGFAQEEDYRPIVHKMMGFGQRVAHVLDKFVPVAQMYTPMAEALWWGIHQILQTREERKIIFTITDGEPDSAVAVKAALETMEGLGIEAVGLGIELDAVKSLFPVADSIRNLSELPSAVFRMLEDKLLDAA